MPCVPYADLTAVQMHLTPLGAASEIVSRLPSHRTQGGGRTSKDSDRERLLGAEKRFDLDRAHRMR